MDFDCLTVRVEPMMAGDLNDVLNIEAGSFSTPWSSRAYEYELRYNDMAHYFVLRVPHGTSNGNGNGNDMFSWLKRLFRPEFNHNGASEIVGYVGYWLMAGEAHISTIAVRPELRGRSL